MNSLTFNMAVLTGAALIVGVVVVARRHQARAEQPPAPAIAATPGKTTAALDKPRPGRIAESAAEPAADPLSPLQEKLDRLNGCYFGHNPGYSNVLEALHPLALYDPTSTDLYKDACTLVAERTELARIGDIHAQMGRDTVAFFSTNAPGDARFQPGVTKDVSDILEVDAAIQRVFQDRFTRRHGLDGDAVVTQLRGLTLPNVGPEIWIRCSEEANP